MKVILPESANACELLESLNDCDPFESVNPGPPFKCLFLTPSILVVNCSTGPFCSFFVQSFVAS
jgi:hypothetical protein